MSPGAPRGALSYGALFASPGLITVPPVDWPRCYSTLPGRVSPTLWDWQEPMLHLVLVAALSDYSYGDSKSYESTGSYERTGIYGSGNYFTATTARRTLRPLQAPVCMVSTMAYATQTEH